VDGLIIKKKWLDLILDGHKTIEVRGHNTHKRGLIALIESGTGLIKGEVEIFNSVPFDGFLKSLYKEHWLTDHQIENLTYKKPYSWWLEYPYRYKEPIPYKHPQGAVIWVKDVFNR